MDRLAAPRKESWQGICDAQKEGIIKNIGVSTYGMKHLRELLQYQLPLPAVHQIDLHPFTTHVEIVNFCREHGIILEAWAPLVRGLRMQHPSIVNLASKYNKEPAQVLVRCSLQKEYIPFTKSRKNRIMLDMDVFDFSLTEQKVLKLDTLDEGLVTDWDPTSCP